MVYSLSYIVKLEMLNASDLDNITMLHHNSSALLNYSRNTTELPIVGLARYEMDSGIENKSTTFTHTLACVLPVNFNIPNSDVAFIATSNSGVRFLIIGSSPSKPIINASSSMPDQPSEKAASMLSISLKSPYGLIKVLDF